MTIKGSKRNDSMRTFRSFIRSLFLLSSISEVSASLSLNKPFQSEFKRLPQSPCVSLFTRNGRIGCGTYSHDTMTGTLLHWSTLTAATGADYYTNLEPTLPSFIAVLEEDEFTSENVAQLMYMNTNSKLLQGVLVLNSTFTSSDSSASSYANSAPVSPRGQNTPSYQLTPGYDYEWNANGDGLLLQDMYGIPSGYVNDVETGEYMSQIAKEQSEFLLASSSSSSSSSEDSKSSGGGIFSGKNLDIPPILAEFDLYMGPEEVDTPTCLSWTNNDGEWAPKCLPLGGNSVWAKAGSPSAAKDNNGDDDNNAEESIILIATNLDSTSMFHDLAPGANTAASNILTVLMAAKLLGESVDDDTLDNLNKKIAFAFFQGEQYGYMGSRSFLRDVAGFECDDGLTVPTVSNKKDDENYTKMSCLNPLRHDLAFSNLGSIDSMIAVDQVGLLSDENTFYVHDSNTGDGLSDMLLAMTSDDWTVSEGSAGSIPPTPLSSLQKISEGGAGGVVLSGYDATFVDNAFYLSHLDSNVNVNINLESIAKAATFVARTALASAYDENKGYYDDAVEYAQGVIAELESDDETLLDLSNCLLTDGKCDTLVTFSSKERLNSREETGLDVGIGQQLGTPPNYYVSIFDGRNGQAYAFVGGKTYGSYTDEDVEYGKDSRDAVLIRPNVLEMGIHGLLNDFLGRGSNGDDELSACKSSSDCTDVSYCSSSGDSAVCSGNNVCVCSRSHYHIALDEAIAPAQNNYTGYFTISEDDEGVSPIYSEPYWDSNIGVRVYRDGAGNGGWALGAGIVLAGAWVVSTIFMKNTLRKQKLY
jgi:nicastrin